MLNDKTILEVQRTTDYNFKQSPTIISPTMLNDKKENFKKKEDIDCQRGAQLEKGVKFKGLPKLFACIQWLC